MTRFIGEYDCKVDAKGRIKLPAALKKQMMPEAKDKFVINRGFEQCLVLYPFNEWEAISAEVNRLNLYVKKNREFIRYFYRGASEVNLDGLTRMLLPKRLLEYAGIKSELVLFAYSNRIEVWDRKIYDRLLTTEPKDFSSLAEDVMGKPDAPEGE